jgi:hypothetical protein
LATNVFAVENDHCTHTLAPTNPQSTLPAKSRQWFRITNEIWSRGGGRVPRNASSVPCGLVYLGRQKIETARLGEGKKRSACPSPTQRGRHARHLRAAPARNNAEAPAPRPTPFFELRALENRSQNSGKNLKSSPIGLLRP